MPVGRATRPSSSAPVLLPDFGVVTGGPARLTVDITAVPSGTAGTAIWTLVGDVPNPSVFAYNLAETTGTDYNWILLPLDKGSITLASGLKANMDTTAVPATIIQAVQQWNATGQGFQTFATAPIPLPDFGLSIGYPYRVTVDVGTGTTSTWP